MALVRTSRAPVDRRPLRPRHPFRGVWVRMFSGRLNARIAAGEDPWSDPALACRSAQLLSDRSRRDLAVGLRRAIARAGRAPEFSAAVRADAEGVQIARPALDQLATALRSRASVHPRGAALVHRLLTSPRSELYAPGYPEALYEAAREALFAFGLDQTAGAESVPDTSDVPASRTANGMTPTRPQHFSRWAPLR